MALTYAFTALCDFCDAEFDYPEKVYGYGDPMRVQIPDGWSLMTLSTPSGKKVSKLLCPEHKNLTFDIIAKETGQPPITPKVA